jgi:hypothetical protein
MSSYVGTKAVLLLHMQGMVPRLHRKAAEVLQLHRQPVCVRDPRAAVAAAPGDGCTESLEIRTSKEVTYL